jgi:hypothetical protein
LSSDPEYLKARYKARLGRLIRMQELNKTQLTQEAAENPNLKNLN